MSSRDNIPKPHDCVQEDRLSALEKRADDHSDRIKLAEARLNDGRVEFAEIRKDLAALAVTLAEIKVALADRNGDLWAKVRDALIFWLVPIVGGAILFSIVKSGQVPGVHQ
jgi:hypothetical protein